EERAPVRGPLREDSAPVASADARRFAAVFVSSRGSPAVKVWDEAGTILATIQESDLGLPTGGDRVSVLLKLSRDGTRLAISAARSSGMSPRAGCSGRLCVWDLTAAREVFRRETEGGYFHPSSFHPDNSALATTWVGSMGARDAGPGGVSV